MDLSQLVLLSLMAFAGAALWRHLEVSKAARALAASYCSKQNLLLLDQSVILSQLKIVKSSSSLFNIERNYRFEFSTIGDERYQGRIQFSGKTLKYIELDPFRF